MLFHRYFGSHAFETLRDAELKTSRISEFNDPFEFAYRTVGVMTPEIARSQTLARINAPGFYDTVLAQAPGLGTHKKARRFIKKKIPTMTAMLQANTPQLVEKLKNQREEIADESVRLVCFSVPEISPASEILQWSHYANKHAGVRIGFELPLGLSGWGKLVPVKYRNDRVPLDITLEADSGPTQTALREAMEAKSLAWAYEQEYRLFVTLAQCIRRDVNGRKEDFISFAPTSVKTVDFGLRCPEPMASSIMELLRQNYPSVEVRQARHHSDDYALEYRALGE
jgi:hypothetical protein